MTIAHNRAIICAEKKPGAVILRKILGFLLVLSLLLACCAAPPEGPEARVRRADELLSRWSMELYCGCHWDGEYAAQEGLYVVMFRRVGEPGAAGQRSGAEEDRGVLPRQRGARVAHIGAAGRGPVKKRRQRAQTRCPAQSIGFYTAERKRRKASRRRPCA